MGLNSPVDGCSSCMRLISLVTLGEGFRLYEGDSNRSVKVQLVSGDSRWCRDAS